MDNFDGIREPLQEIQLINHKSQRDGFDFLDELEMSGITDKEHSKEISMRLQESSNETQDVLKLDYKSLAF